MQVKALEEYLQVQLLRRTSHSVELTAEGERLVPFVQRGLDEQEQGFSTVRAARSGGMLVVSLLASFMSSWLVARLPEFMASHPGIDLRLQCTAALLARYGTLPGPGPLPGPWPLRHAADMPQPARITACWV